MPEAVTPPNPADESKDSSGGGPDPTLLTIDLTRRESAMQETLFTARINALEALTVERFHRLDMAMEQAEELRREQKADTKEAVGAALDAQRDATAKMERSISEQIDALRTNFGTAIGSVERTLSDVKDRLIAMESIKQGQVEQKGESRQVSVTALAVLGAVATLLLTVLAILSFMAGGG